MIILCNIAIISLFLINSSNFSYPHSWKYQFIALLIANLIISIVIFLFHVKGAFIIYLFVFQLGFKYIMTKPFSLNIWFEFFLIMILLLEGIMLLSVGELIFLSIIMITSTLFTNHNEIFWGIESNPRSWDLKISLVILTFIISGLCIIIKLANNLLIKLRDIVNNQKSIIQKMSTANSGLQQYANIAEEKSIINERLKITREIHDTVGYTMTTLLMMLEASTDLIKTDPVKLENLLHQALELIKIGHSDIRQSLRVLRNTKVKDISSLESIKNLITVFHESTGINVKVEYGNLPWVLGRKIDHTIYRFLQEGLTNALTHGDAKNIDIQFWENNSIIHINLEDDGKGSLEIEQGIGLKGMSERLSEISGELSYGNTFLGFSLNAKIPWEKHE
jgi:signal transduction histidine kinase